MDNKNKHFKKNTMKTFYLFLSTAFIMLTSLKSTNAAIIMVEVEDFEFTPAIFTANVGDTITWFWEDGFHTTTSTVIPAGAAPWDSPITSGSPVFFYVVTAPGSYDYKCTPHASMGMVGHFTVNGTATAIEETVAAPQLSFVNHIKNGDLIVNYNLPAYSLLHLNLYDMIGNKVQTFVSSARVSGKHSESFNVAELPKGIYLLELITDNSRVSKRILIQ